MFLFTYLLPLFFLVRSGDIETNPGPRKSYPFMFFHWDLNDLATYDFVKIPLIEALITTHNLMFYLCLKNGSTR